MHCNAQDVELRAVDVEKATQGRLHLSKSHSHSSQPALRPSLTPFPPSKVPRLIHRPHQLCIKPYRPLQPLDPEELIHIVDSSKLGAAQRVR